LFWTLALLAADRALGHRRPVLAMAAAGVALALALLTKIHAWFLLPIVLAWAWYRAGIPRGTAAWGAWAATGVVLFVLCWPWLWYAPIARLARFWGTGIHRISIQVQYFGHVYHDHDVPWHYPWFYFATTVPIGLHGLCALGTLRAWRARGSDRFPFLLLGSI